MRNVILSAVVAWSVLAVGIANAGIIGTYVDASTSNTDNAASPGSAWGTTTDDSFDNLWQTNQGESSSHGSYDVFTGRSMMAAYGATEAAPTIATAITGLTAGNNYWMYLLYGSHSAANNKIQGGLASGSLTAYDNTAPVAVAGTLNYEGGVMNLHQAFLGRAVANSSGQVKAYVATDSTGGTFGRAMYDGLSYVNAGPGVIGTFVEANQANTANAAGGNWATTTDSSTDGLWQLGQTSSHQSWDVFASRDAIVAYGAHETTPTLVTSITGLTPGYKYDVRLIFGSQTDQDHSIKAGLASDSLSVYDLNNSDLALAGYYNYENGYMNLQQALLGTMAADASGQINVYVAANAAGNWDGRALYDGVSYQLNSVPEPGTLALLGTALLGLLAYAWPKRK